MKIHCSSPSQFSYSQIVVSGRTEKDPGNWVNPKGNWNDANEAGETGGSTTCDSSRAIRLTYPPCCSACIQAAKEGSSTEAFEREIGQGSAKLNFELTIESTLT